jgi:predicted GIY-YIG superfamily endonuclease
MSQHYCYILYIPNSSSIATYNGYTNNPPRRLRQHNQEISGGARATSRNKNHNWTYGVIVTSEDPEFTKHVALQLEWQIRYPTRKKPRPSIYNGIKGRTTSLSLVFKNERFSDINFTIYTDFTIDEIIENAEIQPMSSFIFTN